MVVVGVAASNYCSLLLKEALNMPKIAKECLISYKCKISMAITVGQSSPM